MRASPEWDRQRALLRSLVLDRAAREAFLAAPDDGDPLGGQLDRVQLRRTGDALELGLRARSRRGAEPLERMFARSVEGRSMSELVRAFVASPACAAHGELVDRDDRPSIEEAFFDFLCEREIGDPELRLAELALALVRALLVQPRPAFRVPSVIQRSLGASWAIVSIAGREHLVAAVRGKLLRGPIDRLSAEVLRSGGARPGSADARAWRRATSALAKLGFDLR